jgi:arylsulfatase
MADKRPNILVLWGDDIGWWNISYNNRGQMGYRTPNIDRIANGGVAFTDYYGQQSCTAGRAAFITGQNPLRTGLTKVGAPGAEEGLMAEDPTIAELLKPLGYMTGQFGKNHFGDLNKYLPTLHGFDEFYGNLYHLNAEEEPENPDYPKDPVFRNMMGPRGVIHSWATDRDDPAEEPRWGRVGRQKIEDTGPLTKARMETCDEDFTEHTLDFMERAHKAGQPFFIWWNATAMHVWTHCARKHEGKSGQGFYNDAMVAHDELVGKLLDKLDELGIADNTIVVYSTDNGPHYNTWPDAGITPFRSEKNTNWEGAWRVPAFVRWPARFQPGTVVNDIVCHQDWLPTLLAAAGEPDINARLLKGHEAAGKTFNVHIDGFDMVPYFAGETKEGPRKYFAYVNDDGRLVSLRVGDWKVVF